MRVIKALLRMALLCSMPLAAQQPQSVQIETTISGNQEQPKTIYILPWQSPVGVIRIPGEPLTPPQTVLSPLDRQQFLRFIALQQGNGVTEQTQSVNRQEQ